MITRSPRAQPSQRIRGRKLQRIRRNIFASEPLCRICMVEGKVAVATEVDHIVPIHKGGTDTDENRQPLCSRCHERKTAEDLGYKPVVRSTIGKDGHPLDPDHPWNK